MFCLRTCLLPGCLSTSFSFSDNLSLSLTLPLFPLTLLRPRPHGLGFFGIGSSDLPGHEFAFPPRHPSLCLLATNPRFLFFPYTCNPWSYVTVFKLRTLSFFPFYRAHQVTLFRFVPNLKNSLDPKKKIVIECRFFCQQGCVWYPFMWAKLGEPTTGMRLEDWNGTGNQWDFKMHCFLLGISL